MRAPRTTILGSTLVKDLVLLQYLESTYAFFSKVNCANLFSILHSYIVYWEHKVWVFLNFFYSYFLLFRSDFSYVCSITDHVVRLTFQDGTRGKAGCLVVPGCHFRMWCALWPRAVRANTSSLTERPTSHLCSGHCLLCSFSCSWEDTG